MLKQTRRQLATAEKPAALGELTVGVAHEINIPTAVILGNMDVLVADLGDHREPMQTEIDLIIEQVYRIRSIIDRLLQYSRVVGQKHDGKQQPFGQSDIIAAQEAPIGTMALLHEPDPLVHPPVVLSDLIDDTLKLLAHELAGRKIRVHVENRANKAVLIDRQEFQQVLFNLFSNAIASIDEVGAITVATSDQDARLVNICVDDTGRGIEPEHLPLVFDPFFTAGKAQGTGLSCRSATALYGAMGAISGIFNSEQGSRFVVSLPAV